MKEEEKKSLTLEEARSMLSEVIIKLAQNAVFNKRLTEEADQLEQYIAYLEAKEKDTTNESKTDNGE